MSKPRALGKLAKDKPNTWDLYLDAVMFGIRTKKQITTKHSPYFLMFGREARYPSEIPEHYQVDRAVEEVVAKEDVFSGIHQQEKIFQVLRKQNLDAVERKNQESREKNQGPLFNTGDLVWRQNVRSQQRKGGKLDPDFLGPFTVSRVEGKSVDLVDSCGKVLPKVSMDHLKPYLEEMPRIPHKIKAKKNGQDTTTASTTTITDSTTSAATFITGSTNTTTASAATVTGSTNTTTASAATVTGSTNTTTASAATITGSTNTTTASAATVTGSTNTTTASAAPVTGSTNTTTASAAPVTGSTNTTTASAAPVTSSTNTTTASAATVTGSTNTTTASAATVTGSTNTTTASAAPVTGSTNTTTASAATVTGSTNTTTASAAPVTGSTNTTTASAAPVTGSTNTTTASAATVTGSTNTTTASAATVTGSTNTTTASAATVTGSTNTTTASAAPVTSSTNTTTASAATVTGSTNNTTASAAPVTSSTNTTTASAATITATTGSSNSVENYIRDAWNGKSFHLLLSRIGPYKFFLARTAPNMELEDSVVNSYLLILVRRYNSTHLEQAVSIDSFEMSRIWRNEKSKLKILFPQQQRTILLDPFRASPSKLRRCLKSTRTFIQDRGYPPEKWTCKTLPHPL
nr:uncharacterized protein LOC129443447 isoform X2 [Misgurnus anguillicaudatus]